VRRSLLTAARAALFAILAFASVAAALAQYDPSVAGPRESFAEGERLRFAEDWYGAVEAYLAAVSRNPSYGEALAALADCYYELEEYDQALSYARRAAPFRRGDLALADLEGFIRLGLADLAGARAAFAGVLASAQNDLDARFGLALLDLSSGKKTEARSRLEESLRISPQNGRALLSLALIAQDQGKAEEAASLAAKALQYHGGEPRTQYVAARIAASAGDSADAVFHARNALDLRPSYGEARLLLGSLLYEAASYDQAVALMREAVARDRKDGMAWYTLGLAQSGAGKSADAIYSLSTAAALRPDDEMARIALENIVMDSVRLEDPSREAYADWHFKRGAEFEARSLNGQALFEYRRGLAIYPYSVKGRLLFAELLKAEGLPGRYLDELEFLKEGGKATQAVLDSIEIYDSLLAEALGRAWGIDEAALPKRPYKVALMYRPDPAGRLHTAAEEVLLRYLKDILASSTRLAVAPVAPSVRGGGASISEAFKRAREAEADYFLLLSSRDIEIAAELRVGRTGSRATSFRAFRSGNDRVKNGAALVAQLLGSSLAPKGRVLARSQDRVLVDLGMPEGILKGTKLLVLKKGSLQVKAEGLGHAYPPSAILGEVEVTRLGEGASEGILKSGLFFDTVNVGDELVVESAPPAASAAPPTMPPGAAAASPAVATAGPEFPGLFTDIRKLR
jgi:Tfp pilus assembly protein PilF